MNEFTLMMLLILAALRIGYAWGKKEGYKQCVLDHKDVIV